MESFLHTKWISTAASIWIQCTGGASYTFGIYSSILKSSQSYDQSTLDTVSVFKDIGANVGILSGLLYSAVTARRSGLLSGPWVVHVAGAVQCFVGYIFIWASVVGLIGQPPVPVMCLFMLLAAHAQTFFNTANVVSGVENFQYFSGTIVGIMKGFLGLSGAVLIQAYNTICQGDPTTFILILAITPTLVSFLLMPFVKIHGTTSVSEKKHMNGFSYIALIVAAYLMVIIILQNVFVLPARAQIVAFVVLMALLASPFGIAFKAHWDSGRPSLETSCLMYDPKPMPVTEYDGVQEQGEYHEICGEPDQAKSVALSSDANLSDDQDDKVFDLSRAMLTADFWLLFIAMICGMGSGLATINNISQIGESLGYSTVERSSLVALWSIWNFLGRFGAGFLSDILLHKGWARPLFMVITLATLTFGHLIVASGFPGNLYIGSIVVGICYGSQWSLMPTITSEIFGVRHMGTIFNTIAIASPMGSYIFSVRIIGYIYDKAATGEDKSCYGTRCFMVSFFIMASVALLGFMVAFVLFIRTRKFYGRIVVQRLGRSS
ncbi:transcription initiation factor IIB-2-like [Hibiscus syriacus]|uniref:Transcription initiation factor IIB-2-like n=1 Tax=Hibiscus syriacus TaxID=106335 RepID=A0A6A3A7F0_HIBSY|nr:protein NUCLEAR FUSION DEFECTIVE 4-like [Hibiscus syriacus]KAE8699896.1 transcription initiation factor IIB-2-like [Hibiscus syriacus]